MACFDAVQLGEGCWCWNFGSQIAPETSRRVLNAFCQLREASIPGLLDLVPAYTSLAIHYDPLTIASADLQLEVEQLLKNVEKDETDSSGVLHVLPTRYNGEDLESLSAAKGMPSTELAAYHSEVEYLVAMIGFRPHFPYLIGLPEQLATPRRAEPRTRVPAGSVAIGGEQTGIYPEEGPGGWHLIGWTDPSALQAIQPGDRVRFQPMESP